MRPIATALILLLAVLLAACPTPRRTSFGGGGDDDDATDDDDASWDDDDGEDPDEDGLGSNFEDWLGTDPEDADSDGDGFEDGEEYLSYFLPLDGSDWPYVGGYPRGPLPDSVEGEGWGFGQVSNDWAAEDQHGQELQLHRFYGNVVVVELAAEWCGPCRQAAETLEDEYQDRRDDGFVVIQILIDGIDFGVDPDPEQWAAEFDLTIPVIADPLQELAQHYVTGTSFGIPNYTYLDRELRVDRFFQEGGIIDWSRVDDLLDEPAPEVDWPIP